MGRFFALSLALPAIYKSKTRNKTRMKIRPDFGFWIAAMLVATSIAYLLAVNNLSTQGYEIKRLENTLAQAKAERDRLEIEAASRKAIQSMDLEIKTLNLVPSKNMKYLPKQGFSYK